MKNSSKRINRIQKLCEDRIIDSNSVAALEKVSENFSFTITNQMYDLIDKSNPLDPIALQFIPSENELQMTEGESIDPISDALFSPVKGIVHRHPDRCLFMPVHVCPLYCRFCFRREKVGSQAETLLKHELEIAYDYINEHKEIWEVILTGGDPLILKPKILAAIIKKINAIKQVEIIRIHTRVPIVESQRINSDMLAALKSDKPIYIIIHVNHPKEFTPLALQACADLADHGIPLLSQTVLLKGINDNIETLTQLMRCCVKNKIKPYYLHQADLAQGTQHFRTSIESGQMLMKQLRGRISGLCQPLYVLDIPGGYGKVPIASPYIKKVDSTIKHEVSYKVEDYQGNLHTYTPTTKLTK